MDMVCINPWIEFDWVRNFGKLYGLDCVLWDDSDSVF